MMSTSSIDLKVARLLAVILYALAAILGIPLAILTLASLAAGKWGVLAIAAILGPIVGLSAWLARTLWHGRPLPGAIVAGFSLLALLSLVAVPVGLLVHLRMPFWAFVLLLLSIPYLMAVATAVRGGSRKPKGLDDFA